MKKFLTLLGSISLTAGTAITVISCTPTESSINEDKTSEDKTSEDKTNEDETSEDKTNEDETSEDKISEEFTKILNMNEAERAALKEHNDEWMDNVLKSDYAAIIVEMYADNHDTASEIVTEEMFNEFVSYSISILTLEVLKFIEEDNFEEVSILIENLKEVLALKLANAENKLWAQSVINHFENVKNN